MKVDYRREMGKGSFILEIEKVMSNGKGMHEGRVGTPFSGATTISPRRLRFGNDTVFRPPCYTARMLQGTPFIYQGRNRMTNPV